jgi:uncharacterized protein (DUF885 family)
LLRVPNVFALRLVLFALAPGILCAAQSTPSATPPLSSRVKTLNTIFSDAWEDRLKHEPEFASTIGDNRYNDQLSNFSVQAYNESLARGRGFLTRLAEVDTTGMSDQEQLSKELMVRELIEDQEEARFKPWELPVNQFDGLQVDLPQLVPQLNFTRAARLPDGKGAGRSQRHRQPKAAGQPIRSSHTEVSRFGLCDRAGAD